MFYITIFAFFRLHNSLHRQRPRGLYKPARHLFFSASKLIALLLVLLLVFVDGSYSFCFIVSFHFLGYLPFRGQTQLDLLLLLFLWL